MTKIDKQSREKNLWREKFGWFWYNDYEIFSATDSELKEKIERFSDEGITHLMTFSCTHFRWSYVNFWPEINRTIKRICNIAHIYGIKVTEHHSAHLTFNPRDDESMEFMRNILEKRQSDLSKWPGLLNDVTGELEINGLKLSSFRQIDGRTGEAVYTAYRGYAMCFNNPDYVREYLKSLDAVYDCGVDGIMTDDVQYFGESCACKHCRKLFAEKTGYELPQPGNDWNKWFENYQNESFIAWLQFRADSLVEFHKQVMAHYQRRGCNLLRPWYRSHSLNHGLLPYHLENLPALDWVFQEACFSTIIRYSWPGWALEQKHRVSVARQRKIPPMVLFYPDCLDSMVFTWALCRSWGSIYTATPEGAENEFSEAPLREFEQKHETLLDELSNVAVIGFYDSYENRLLNPEYNCSRIRAWMQACVLSNTPYDLFMNTELERLEGYKVVVAVDHGLMKPYEITALRSFAKDGGCLIISESSGRYDSAMRIRENQKWLHLWDIPPFDFSGKTFIEQHYGKGRIIIINEKLMAFPLALECSINRWQEPAQYEKCTINMEQAQIDALLFKEFISHISGTNQLQLGQLNDYLHAGLFKTSEGKFVLHLVNVGGTRKLNSTGLVSHEDKIPFPELPGGEIILNLDNKKEQSLIKNVNMVTLEGGVQKLKYLTENGKITIFLPEKSFKKYAIIEIINEKESQNFIK